MLPSIMKVYIFQRLNLDWRHNSINFNYNRTPTFFSFLAFLAFFVLTGGGVGAFSSSLLSALLLLDGATLFFFDGVSVD